MKFLALAAVATALSLRTMVSSPEDIVKYFLEMGSASAAMADLDADKSGNVTLGEVQSKLNELGADEADKEIAEGLFHSISQGKDSFNATQAEHWE